MKSDRQDYDVLIVGAGPAGSTTALLLVRFGLRVALIDLHRSKHFVVGECLPPQSRPLLEQLGLWTKFKDEGHRPYYGNQSAWGHSSLRSTDFINTPWGHGWHLDRIKFDNMILDTARNEGVDIYLDVTITTIQHVDKWTIKGQFKEAFNANFVVDATGRLSFLSVKLGSTRCSIDYQVAVVARFKNINNDYDPDSVTLIEAVEMGWWYTAIIPSGHRVVILFTDTVHARLFRDAFFFLKELRKTLHISNRIFPVYSLIETPKVLLANTSILNELVGHKWLSVGDAAVAYDPVSSYGLISALRCSVNASSAIKCSINGNHSVLNRYEDQIKQEFNRFIVRLKDIYSKERRFPQSRYWNRL